MSRLGLLISALLCAAASQACQALQWPLCNFDEQCVQYHAHCNLNPAITCPGGTGGTGGIDTPGPTPGTVLRVGTCNDPGTHLAISDELFTTRTVDPTDPQHRRLVPNGAPRQCEPFSVVWNVCNFGTVRSGAKPYQVHFEDETSRASNPGLKFDYPSMAQALNPCECAMGTYETQTGLLCGPPISFIVPTKITTMDFTAKSGLPATGAFTIQQAP